MASLTTREPARWGRSFRREEAGPPAWVQWIVAGLAAGAILLAQWLHGGVMRPVFGLPSFWLLWLAALVGVRSLVAGTGAVRWGVLLMVAWVGWCAVRSPDPWLGAIAFRQACGAGLLFLLMANVVVGNGPRLGFIGILLLGALAQAVVGWMQIRGEVVSIPGPWYSEQLRLWYESSDARRAHGTYLNANHLAWFLNGTALLALGVSLLGRVNRGWRLLLLIVSGVLLAASLLTLSRGGMLALGMAFLTLVPLGLMLIWWSRAHPRILWVPAVAVLLPLAAFSVAKARHAALEPRLQQLWHDPYRYAVWETAGEQFRQNIWQGGGPGMFTYFARYWRSGEGGFDDYYVHNDWLQTAAEYGLPGLLLMLTLALVCLGSGWRRCRDQVARWVPGAPSGSLRAGIALGALLAAVAMMVHTGLDFNLQLVANALFAAAIAGLLAPPLRRQPGPLTTGAGIVLCLGVALIFWRGQSEWDWLRAENAALRGESSAALAAIGEGLMRDPYHPKLHRLRGELLAARAQAERSLPLTREAEAAFRRAIALAPLDRGNYLRLAEVLLARQLESEALETARRAIALAPEQAQAYELCGQIYEAMGLLEDAVAMYEDSLSRANGSYGRERLKAVKRQLASGVLLE